MGASRTRATAFALACLSVLGLVAFLGTGAPTAGAAAEGCPNAGAPGVGFLPECRAWEMVSPTDKNGGYVMPISSRTRAARDGEAVTFVSQQGFADAQGSGAGFEYMAERSDDPAPGNNGWATHGLIPLQEAQTDISNAWVYIPRYEGPISDDLSTGIFFAWSPLTQDPWMEDVTNLYLRRDLDLPGTGSYQLVTECPRCAELEVPFSSDLKASILGEAKYAISDTSEDFSHIFFESGLPLTADSVAGPLGARKLFEWEDGALELAGILPSGNAAPRSSGGSSTRGPNQTLSWPALTGNSVSTDGSRVVFTVPPDNTVPATGQLYMRINGRSTVQLSVAEPAEPAPSHFPQFWDASADLSRVIFSSDRHLTADAPPIGIQTVYMWELQPFDEIQQVAVNATGGSFTLTFNSRTTNPLPFDAPATTVQAELEALPSVKPGNVSVGGGPGGAGGSTPYTVTFTGDFSGANVAKLTASGSSLTGTPKSVTVTTTQPVQNLTNLAVDEEPAGIDSDQAKGIGISDDGSHVYFLARSRLVPGASSSCSNLDPCIYAWDEGDLSFVAPINDPNPLEQLHTLYGFEVSGFRSKETRLTPAGDHLLFWARRGEDVQSSHGGVDSVHAVGQLYVYDAEADTVQCASCSALAAETTHRASATTIIPDSGHVPQGTYEARPISSDGRYVFFTTAERLVREDTNGVEDAYVFDTKTGTQALLSSGESSESSYFLDASADGRNVFFLSAEQLSGWDVDQNYDVYDARLGGGFPEPPLPPASCQGDACQPEARSLNDPTPASSNLNGAGNVREQQRGRRGRCHRHRGGANRSRARRRCARRGPRQSARSRRIDAERRAER